MNNRNMAYRSIVKGTAIFGGVQVFTILINIVRGKFVALFLGPLGMGVYSLLLSTVNMVIQMAGLGLGFVAVKEIAQANEDNNLYQISFVVSILRKLIIVSALIGALLTLLSSYWLSLFTFGNTEYVLSFIALSAMVLFSILATGDISILQGLRSLKELAISTIVGPIVGLLAGIPLYYFFREKGIVPAMIILSISTYIVNRYFVKRKKIPKVVVTLKQVSSHGKQMLLLGVFLMAATLIGTITVYIINAYIRYLSGNEIDVGYFQAASSITNQYVGVIFSAMAVDYFPKLAAVCNNKHEMLNTVSQQIEIVMLIVTPLLIVVLVLAPFLVNLLLSKEFVDVIPLIRLFSVGIFFKALSYPMGYLAFANGDKRIFFLLEGVAGNILAIIAYTIGYWKFGLLGLGYAYVFSYIIYIILVLTVVYFKYQYFMSFNMIRLIIPLLTQLLIAFCLFYLDIFSLPFLYFYSSILIVFSVIYSYWQLNNRIDIADFIKSKLKNNPNLKK